jgi:uncharacterized protein (DUF697 family)
MSMIHILHPKAEQEADRRRLAARDEAAKAPTQTAAVSTSRPLTNPTTVDSPAPPVSTSRPSGAKRIIGQSTDIDPLLNPDPLMFGAAPVPSAAEPETPLAPGPEQVVPQGAAAATVNQPATKAPPKKSGFTDALSGFGAGLRGDDAFSKVSGHTAGSITGTAANVVSGTATGIGGVNSVSGALGGGVLPSLSEAMLGVDPGQVAKHLGVGMQAGAWMAKEAAGEKPTDVAGEARKDYVAADMQRMVARKNKKGMLKSAVLKALAAKRLGDSVQAGGHRAAYEGTMEESEKLNEARPETSSMTKAMQMAALPGQALNKTGQTINGADGEEDLLKGNLKTAAAVSALGLGTQATKAGLATAGHIVAPGLGGVTAATAVKGTGYAARLAGTVLSKPFEWLGGNKQDQADAFDKHLDGGSAEERAAGTAQTQAGSILHRGFRSRGQATGEGGVGWEKSGAKTADPAPVAGESYKEGGITGWLKGLWSSGKHQAKTEASHAVDDVKTTALNARKTAVDAKDSAKGFGSRIKDKLSSWWSKLTGPKKPAEEDQGVEMTSR